VYHNGMGGPRRPSPRDGMHGAYLGPEFAAEDIREFLDARGYPYRRMGDDDWARAVAARLQAGDVVGVVHGRMEFGPRSLGNRSILGDARSRDMQSTMNLKIKHRESFRPFAPSVLEERVGDWFEFDRPSPYMLMVAPVRAEHRTPNGAPAADGDDLIAWVNTPRSSVPAITHVDYSARLQTVDADTNPRYHAILEEFEKATGVGVIINTSFNVRGEPIVCTPEDAYRCFMRTEMDCLVLGPFVLDKKEQPRFDDKENWRETFQLD
jgi:carbamoyltransferase